MFKKAVEAKQQQRLSGADKKKFKRTVKERFPNASEADIDLLLSPKAEITLAKFQNRVHLYSVEGGYPVFFDVDGRNKEIYPTVFSLWQVPDLLPYFLLKGGEVSQFIIGGADLMFPGISLPVEGLPSFLAGEPWAVKVPGNLAPIAVGITTMSSTEALNAGLRGRALRITHHYGDTLWESVEGHLVPNAGFLEKVVFEDPSLASSCQDSDACQDLNDASGEHQNDIDTTGIEHSEDVVDSHSGANDGLSEQKDGLSNFSEQIIMDVGGLKVTEDVSAAEMNEENPHPLSAEDVDVLLDKCLLQALHTMVKDNDLPMPGSTLWSNHVLSCRPSGIVLDVKKSSHKKLSKWLQAKASSGLISAKEDKYKKETMLLAVNRKHPDYMSFKPEKREVEKLNQKSDNAAGESQSHTLLEVSEIYKPSVHVNPIFDSVGADTKKLYTASEASDVVFSYVERQNLVKTTNKSIVVLDAILCDALFKGVIKKGSTYPSEIHKKDLGPAFISRMQPHHIVARGSDSVVRKGGVKAIQLLTERRGGNKKVTRVSGFESFLMDAEALASELQKKFACSTSVAELPGKKGHEVLVQGGVIDNMAKHLIEQYGIPKRYIEILDKTRK